MNEIISYLSNVVWGIPMISLILFVGIFISVKLNFIQIAGLKHGFQLITGKYDNPSDDGHISHFQALSTALSATIGTGNIAGVATAIAAGGPGSLFWMWISAVFGMAVKFSSATLAVKYRKVTDDSVKGGPMYYIEMGLKEKYGWNAKWLAFLFALSTAIAAFGIGNMVQSNSVADSLASLFTFKDPFYFKLITGLILALLTGLVIVGGIKRIASVASKLMPVMTIFYIFAALIVIFINYKEILPAFTLIFKEAFTGKAAGGAILGSTVIYTMRMGFARGIFSNEAGLGTAPMAHSAVKTTHPAREGFVAMLGPLIDTLIVCTLTGLVIVISGLYSQGLNGAPLTGAAFENSLPGIGNIIVSFSLALFAYSTLIGWYFYGEKGIEYLFPKINIIPLYQMLWIILIPIGAVMELKVVWNISDVFNGFMALPNLIGVVLLSGVVATEVKKYVGNKENYKKYNS